MSAIDKIYGTQGQYIELKSWLLKNQKPIKSLVGWSSREGDKYEYVLPTDHLYDEKGYSQDHRPISNFSREIDKWLIENCNIKWVIDRIKYQYANSPI